MNNCTSPGQISLYQGATYSQTWRWGAAPLVYKSITAVTVQTPLTVTVLAHGVPDGWSVALADLVGLEPLNASQWPPATTDFHSASLIDANTLAFRDIDGNRSGTYSTGGVIAYFTPISLIGASAVFNVYTYPPSSVTGLQTPILTANAVVVDAAKTITVTLTSANTATLTASQYSYALVITDASGNVTVLDSGIVATLPIGIGQ